jgi:hypothetical protein
LPVTFTLAGSPRSSVQLAAVTANRRTTIDVPLFPPAEAVTDFEVADGKAADGYPHVLGEGNRDGHASPGETVAILLREGSEMRAAEIFTNHACIDNSIRIAEGGTARCRRCAPPANPDTRCTCAGLRYAAVEFPVWYKQ